MCVYFSSSMSACLSVHVCAHTRIHTHTFFHQNHLKVNCRYYISPGTISHICPPNKNILHYEHDAFLSKNSDIVTSLRTSIKHTCILSPTVRTALTDFFFNIGGSYWWLIACFIVLFKLTLIIFFYYSDVFEKFRSAVLKNVPQKMSGHCNAFFFLCG